MIKLTVFYYNSKEFGNTYFYKDFEEARRVVKELKKLKHITGIRLEKVAG